MKEFFYENFAYPRGRMGTDDLDKLSEQDFHEQVRRNVQSLRIGEEKLSDDLPMITNPTDQLEPRIP